MSNNFLVTSAWGPGLIGMVIAGSMYGVSLAQSFHYAWFFADDPISMKSLVLLVFVADALHLVGATDLYWYLLVFCHRNYSDKCEKDLPWGGFLVVPMNYVINFSVQCFYCNRVWIITGKKKSITMAILLMALAQFVLGIWASVENVRNGTMKYLFTTPLIPIAAGVSTVCDIIITGTIFRYLWRSELRGRTHIIRDLVIVFINMGTLTCVISTIVCVVYAFQGNHYWVEAPAVIISRCYINSLLAALNARRVIREREKRRLHISIEIPTLSTII